MKCLCAVKRLLLSDMVLFYGRRGGCVSFPVFAARLACRKWTTYAQIPSLIYWGKKTRCNCVSFCFELFVATAGRLSTNETNQKKLILLNLKVNLWTINPSCFSAKLSTVNKSSSLSPLPDNRDRNWYSKRLHGFLTDYENVIASAQRRSVGSWQIAPIFSRKAARSVLISRRG